MAKDLVTQLNDSADIYGLVKISFLSLDEKTDLLLKKT